MAQSPSPSESHLEQGFQNLKVDMNKLRSDLADVAQALLDAGKTEAGEAKARLQAMAQERLEGVRRALDVARERGRSALDVAKERGLSATDVVKQQVEEKPLMSMVVAFGAGMLLGALMKRK